MRKIHMFAAGLVLVLSQAAVRAQSAASSITLSPNGTSYICNTGADTLFYSLSATNIPAGTNVVVYKSTDSLFNPYAAQGDSIAFVPGQSIPRDTLNFGSCVKIIGQFIDACGPSGQEGRNEYIVLTSGNGFSVNSLGIDFSSQNNTSGAANNDININANPCGYKTPTASLIATLRQGSCNASNVIPASPGDSIPPNVIVVVFTSDSVSASYSLNGLCNKGYPVYILQSACVRTIGAFTNASRCDAPSRYRTTRAVDQAKGCSNNFTYDLCDIFNLDGTYAIRQEGTDTASVANNGIRRNTIDSCGGIDYSQITFSGDTLLKYPLQNPDVVCNTTYYLKAITNPAGSQPVSNTIAFQLVCLGVQAQVRDAEICSGQSATIALSDNNPSATISWTVSAGPNISGAANGSGSSINQVLANSGSQPDSVVYSIVSAFQQCTSAKNVTVVVNPIPQPAIGGNPLICNNGSTTLSVPGQYDSVRWNTGATSASIEVSQPGDYSVTVYQDGCSGSDQVSVSSGQVDVRISGTTVLCNGGQTTLTAIGEFDSLRWNINATTASITVTQPGIYTVTVYANGCSGTASAEVLANSVPVEIEGAADICSGGTVDLSVSGEYDSVRWNTGETTFTITVGTGGIYSVTVYSRGCSGSASVNISEGTAPQAFSLGNDTSYCGSFTRVLDAGDPSASWNTQATGSTITVSEPGTYIATVSNDCGSVSDTIIILQYGLPEVDLGSDTAICEEELVLNGPSEQESYSWSTGEQGGTITVTQPGTYWLEVTDGNGCSASDTILVGQDCANTIFIPNAFTPNGDEENDIFYVRGNPDNASILAMTVFDRWGVKVFEANDILPDDPALGWDGTYKNKPVQKDVYAYRVVVRYVNGEEESYNGNVTLLR